MSLSLATKAKSLQGHEQASETPTEAAPACTAPQPCASLPVPAAVVAVGREERGQVTAGVPPPKWAEPLPWPLALPSPLAPAVVAANTPDTDVEDGLAMDEAAVEGVHQAHGVLL